MTFNARWLIYFTHFAGQQHQGSVWIEADQKQPFHRLSHPTVLMHHVQCDGGRQGPVCKTVCHGNGPGGNWQNFFCLLWLTKAWSMLVLSHITSSSGMPETLCSCLWEYFHRIGSVSFPKEFCIICIKKLSEILWEKCWSPLITIPGSVNLIS